jgi:hypothetical protein
LSSLSNYACPFMTKDCWISAIVSKEPISEEQILG